MEIHALSTLAYENNVAIGIYMYICEKKARQRIHQSSQLLMTAPGVYTCIFAMPLYVTSSMFALINVY